MSTTMIHLALVLLVYGQTLANDVEFSIVIPVKNASAACIRTLASLSDQHYQKWHAYVVDDKSTDGLEETYKTFRQQHPALQGKISFIKLANSYGKLHMLYRTILGLPQSIVTVMLPGYRYASKLALSKLAEMFAYSGVWVVTGNYTRATGERINALFSPKEIAANLFRSKPVSSVGLPCAFRTELFKRIKLHDLMQGGHFSTATEEACIFPLLEMSSQGHYRHINEILCIDSARPESVENEQRRIIHRKKPYAPLQTLQPAHGDKRTTVVVYSKDRPLQLYAFLESLKAHVSGSYDVVVIYTTSHSSYDKAYVTVQTTFSDVTWLKQRTRAEFKKMTLDAIYKRKGAYVLFAVDDIIVKDTFNIDDCMELLELTGAHGFYLRLGTHVTHCYSLRMRTGVPPLMEIKDGVFAWQFGAGRGEWKHMCNLDMTLYRKGDIRSALESLEYSLPNELEAWWESYASGVLVGLCYEMTKIVNIPLNLVQSYAAGNRCMHYRSAAQLLKVFNDGFKIDIRVLFHVKNLAPHMEHEPHFIKRT